MSQSGVEAAAFFRDVASHRTVWTVQDENGCPAPMTPSGRRSMPFWSSLSRAKKIIKTTPTYVAMEPREISVDEWMHEWLPGLKRDGLLIGINWSGPRAVGWDFEVDQVLARLEAAHTSRATSQDQG
ncbi:DUF2750 domain-containing protein [Nonomuraea phyllanthi]|uniref:DUF2750 domain-containing protein n=1 Tax=Nonomuraea phyllanthi TaxID=2219224 RepID=A0A5C4VXJ2_9ACTN|nr:DUF2750 domain-containing protein [Nonomuraea phyllanthi]KAB8190601.1 DUF2750 domain-containing protein [Nonomuraea phyllanthi]QFY05774.1 DUF2750 domain-containing protein [Nonomuraea phyllanthi]